MDIDFSMLTFDDISEYFSVIFKKIVLFFNPEYDGTFKIGFIDIIL